MTTVEAPAETTVQPVTRADVLHRAADLLEEFGWQQGEYGPWKTGGIGSFCATGAIWRAELDLGWDAGDNTIARSVIKGRNLTGWNDKPGRTAKHVVARLRAAANASPL